MIHAPHRSPGPGSAAAKLGGTVAIVAVTTLLPAGQPAWFAVPAAGLVGAMTLLHVSPLRVLQRMLWLAPFVAGAALAAALSARGPDWRILALRSGLCLTAVVLLGESTPLADLLAVLRRLRVPGLLVTTLTLMHRYVFLLGDESARMGRARAARSFNSNRVLAWTNAASVVGLLFVRAYERAERVFDAMCARGWRP